MFFDEWSSIFWKIIHFPTQLKKRIFHDHFQKKTFFSNSSKKAKKCWKLMNRSKKLTWIVKLWTLFFQFLGISYLSLTLFPGIKKWEGISKIFVLDHIVLWSPDWGDTKKRKFHWISSMLQLTFLREYKSEFFHLGLKGNHSTCKRLLFWKTDGFVSCVTIPIVQKFRKMP